ncbi:MAG: methyltransferase domain-containing protein [Acidobacteria bacterium]|nr:methyltransferase domain-containing protein [Acidobacteriota bacterium]
MNEILQYYEQSNESARLHSGSGLLERIRTQDILQRYLPPPPAKVLDIGGGPGDHAGWLAAQGYEVHLLDPVAKHLEQAARFPLAGIQQGDARALPCEDQCVDATLLLGPLYHLPERADRIQALREAHRALRPGGVLCTAAISRWASLLHSLVDGFVDDDAFWPVLQRDLLEGQHRNDTGNLLYFTTAVFHRPQELREELAEAGFSNIQVIAVEGPGWLAKDFDNRWQDASRRERILTLVRQVECEEPMLGSSMHLIATGYKGLL